MSSHSSDSASTPASAPSSTSTTPAATTTSSTPSTTNAAASSSSSSSSPSSSSTAGTSTSSSSTTSTSGQSSSSTTAAAVASETVISSGGTVETITQLITPTVTASPSSQNSSSSNSFFKNTGAVAGVFTVVGLVVVGLVIALAINCVRRRRAQKFDRDVAQAAAEAAASSRSPFEDYSYNNTTGGGSGGGGGGGQYGYSGDSHGTYQLPPMQPNDPYGMTEMSQYDPYTMGAASLAAAAVVGRSRGRKESEPGAPGIAGVGARGLAHEPSGRAPYHAFAGPQPHELQGSSGTLRSPRGTNQDVLEAVGLAGPNSGPYPSLSPSNTISNASAFVTRKPSDTTQNTHLSGRSQFGSVSSHPTKLQPGYPVVDSYYPQRQDSHSPDPFAGYPPQVMPPSTVSLPNPHDATVPSPSPPGHQSEHNEDDGDLGSATALQGEEQRLSYQDDADYGQGSRVLRVANE